MTGKVRRISHGSRGTTLAKLDRRTKESRLLERVRADVADMLGGEERLSAAQKIGLDRLAIVTLRLSLYDQKLASGQPLADRDSRIYSALHNCQRLLLRDVPNMGRKHENDDLSALVEDVVRRRRRAAKAERRAVA